MGGSQTHADNNMAFFVKSSTTLFVNRIPVLLVCRFRRKPTSTLFALRALYLLMEVHANVGILIASAPISHHPLFARNLNIRYVDLSHTLHRESVEVKINLFISTARWRTLPLKYSHLVEASPLLPFLYSLHKTLSPTCGGKFESVHSSKRPLTLLHCSAR